MESSTVEIELPPLAPAPPIDRRGDVETKHERAGRLLADAGCDGVFITHPANFRWLCGTAPARGLVAPAEEPVLYYTPTARWLICSSVDTQRFFDEELDGLGFQLKEWPWYADRDGYMGDLANGRRIACDRALRDWTDVGSFAERERTCLSPYTLDRYRELGKLLAHALEATARGIARGDSENEIAGHLAHRLRRHGAEPSALQVGTLERVRRFPRFCPTSALVEGGCTVQATAEKFGLFATAARSVYFGMPNKESRGDWDLAVRQNVLCLAVAKPAERIGDALVRGCAGLRGTGAEHAWRSNPVGWRTGHAAADGLLLPSAAERFLSGMPVVWQARVGPAALCDTFVLGENGWETITAPEEWPLRRAVVGEERFDRPDVLILPE